MNEVLVFKRELRLVSPRMTGDDVKSWQRHLSIDDDGIFGKDTDAATRRAQLTLGLPVTGIVTKALVDAANASTFEDKTEPGRPITTPPVELPTLASLVSKFIQATKYTKANRKPSAIKHIVLHTAEIGESLQGAEALANVCASPTARDASWHFAVDADSITQSVKVSDVAWHAPGCNADGIGIEMAGRANQTAEEWADKFSVSMLDRCAKLVAVLCHDYDVPPVLVDEAGLLAGKRGITLHSTVSKAFKKSDHWDPGPHFPVDAFIVKVRAYLGV